MGVFAAATTFRSATEIDGATNLPTTPKVAF